MVVHVVRGSWASPEQWIEFLHKGKCLEARYVEDFAYLLRTCIKLILIAQMGLPTRSKVSIKARLIAECQESLSSPRS